MSSQSHHQQATASSISASKPPKSPRIGSTPATAATSGVHLSSASGDVIVLPTAAVHLVLVARDMIDNLRLDDGTGDGSKEAIKVPLPSVDTKTLRLVVDWATQHANNPPPRDHETTPGTAGTLNQGQRGDGDESSDDDEANSDEDDTHSGPSPGLPQLTDWDKAFMATIDGDRDQLFRLANAANFMQIQGLTNMCCARIAEKIQHRSIPAVREYLNLEDDFDEDERARVLADTAWAEAGVDVE